MGLYPHKKQRTPRLTERQKQKRVEFAKNNRRRDWDSAVFYDEKEFELYGSPNRKNDVIWDDHGVQYRHGEVPHPAKFMVGAAISSRGATRLVPYTGTIDSDKFQEMISEILPDIKKMYPKGDWFLVQDSAKPHASKSSQAFLAEKVPSSIPPREWPANSPDISAIENVYGDQQEKVYEKDPQTLAAMEKIVRAEWKKLTPEKCKKIRFCCPQTPSQDSGDGRRIRSYLNLTARLSLIKILKIILLPCRMRKIQNGVANNFLSPFNFFSFLFT